MADTAQLSVAPDEDLVLRLRRGDATAFSVLFERHRARAVSYAARMTGSIDDAEKLAHDAFVRLAKDASRLDASRPFRMQLFAVLREIVSDFVAKNRPEARASLERARPAGNTAEPLPEDLRGLFDSLMKLGPAYREVLYLRVFEGMSYDEMAELTGEKVSTLRGRLNHSVEQLRKEVR